MENNITLSQFKAGAALPKPLYVTKLEQELLLDRLGMSECIVECIAQTRVTGHLTDDELRALDRAAYDQRCSEIGEVIATKCDYIDSCVRKGYLPALVTTDRDYADIVEDICDGSTYFCAEDDSVEAYKCGDVGGRSKAWWARRHAAADQLELKLTALLGRKITFARY